MKTSPFRLAAFTLLLSTSFLSAKDTDILPNLKPLVEPVTREFDQIPADRQLALKKIALFIRSKVQAKETAATDLHLHAQQPPQPLDPDLGADCRFLL